MRDTMIIHAATRYYVDVLFCRDDDAGYPICL